MVLGLNFTTNTRQPQLLLQPPPQLLLQLPPPKTQPRVRLLFTLGDSNSPHLMVLG